MESKRKKEVKWHHGSGWPFAEAGHRYLQLLPAYESYLLNLAAPEAVDFDSSSEGPTDDSQASSSEDENSSFSCLSDTSSGDDWVESESV